MRLPVLAACLALAAPVAAQTDAPAVTVGTFSEGEPMTVDAALAHAAHVVTVGAFTEGQPMTVDAALADAAALDGQTVRVAGTIRQVCQMAGCWLTFSTGQGQTLRVLTHDEGGDEDESITFPKDAAGRPVEVVGTLRSVEESVARRRHLAEDAGASAAEIAAITEPTRSVTLLATGARISM